MLFLQIVATLILAVVLFLAYSALFFNKKPAEVRQKQATVIIGNLTRIDSRDTYFFETEYRLTSTLQGQKTPTVIFKRFFDGDIDVQFGATSGQAQIQDFGRYKLALLEEALPDIKGQLVDKKA